MDRRTFLRNVPVAALASAAAGEPSGFDFDTPYSRIGTDSVKWDRQIRLYGRDHIVAGMGIADMDFKAAPCITKALAERIQHENWGYIDTPKSFIDAVVGWNKRRYGITIDPEKMLLSTGVHPGIIAALHAFSPPGSKVLMMTPIYDGFYGDLAFCQNEPEEIPMKLSSGRYSMDFEELERRISDRTHVAIFCNPHNPTGNCWSREDMTRFGEICTRRRVIVFADEIHCDFVTKGNAYTPYCSIENRDIAKNSITFKAASKSFSLSAMKIAWMFSDNPDLIARVRTRNHQDLTTLSYVANRAALDEGEAWLNQLIPYIDANHTFVESFVRERIPLMKAVKAQGTYLSWLDVSKLAQRIDAAGMASEANKKRASGKPLTAESMVERWLIDNAKVQINPGTNYGLGGGGHMRMNIGTSRRTLELALSNIAEAAGRL